MKPLSVKKFRKMIRKPNGSFEVFKIVSNNNLSVKICSAIQKLQSGSETDGKIGSIFRKYKQLFWDTLPGVLPPKKSEDHEIVVEEGTKKPHRLLFQLSPEELKSAKSYLYSLVESKKIRPHKSPYGAPFFREIKRIVVCVDLLTIVQLIK